MRSVLVLLVAGRGCYHPPAPAALAGAALPAHAGNVPDACAAGKAPDNTLERIETRENIPQYSKAF